MKLSDTMRDAITEAAWVESRLTWRVAGRKSTVAALHRRGLTDAAGYLTDAGKAVRVETGAEDDTDVTVVETETVKPSAAIGGCEGPCLDGHPCIKCQKVMAWDAQIERDDAIRQGRTTAVTRVVMGPTDTNYVGDYWRLRYGTNGNVLFDEMTIPRRDVRKGDVILWTGEYTGWVHVVRAFTSNRQVSNFRAGYGVITPKDPADFRDETRIDAGGSTWTSKPSDELVTVRRPVGPEPVEAARESRDGVIGQLRGLLRL